MNTIKTQLYTNDYSTQSKWVLIIYLAEKYSGNIHELDNFYIHTIQNLKNKINIGRIIICAYKIHHHDILLTDLINIFPSQIMDIDPNQKLKKIFILKKYLNNNKNIILLDYGIGISNTIFEIDTNKIYTYLEQSNINQIYKNVLNKLKINKIIIPSVIIISSTPRFVEYIEYSEIIGHRLASNNEDIITNIALTMAQSKLGIQISDLSKYNDIFNKYSPNNNYFIDSSNFLSKKENIKIDQKDNTTGNILYRNADYIFYPYIYIDSAYNNLELRKEDITTKKSIYPYFKTINNKELTGVFIKREKMLPNIVPKVLHYIWLFDEPNQKYIDSWTRILREHWNIIVWTEEKLVIEILNNTPLMNVYNSSIDRNMKYIIACFTILEKYGGIAIDSFIIPRKIISDELLKYKFTISYTDELNQFPNLSFRFISGVTGKIDKNIISYPQLYHQIRSILLSSDKTDNKINAIQNTIIHGKDIMIYPSYYFNPNSELFPIELLDKAFSINQYKSTNVDVHKKSELRREYNVTSDGIFTLLSENPRDRLLNKNTT